MLKPRQQQRRQAARAVRVASAHGRNQRLTLVEPLFNLRELCKHLILLEDHLAHADKQCPDCIRKHLLTIEALAEEATALDPAGIYACGGGLTAEMARRWIELLVDGTDAAKVAQMVRIVRKQLTPMVFDPRGAAVLDRVAAVHMHRVAHSPEEAAGVVLITG